MQEIKKGWINIKIGDILKVLTDYHANGSYERLKENVELLDTKDYAIMIRTTNFEQDNFDNLLYITEAAYNYLSKSKVYEGDIVMNKIANPGSVYYVPDLGGPISLAMNLFLLRFSEEVNQRFMYYYLKANENYIKGFANGTATKTIRKDVVRDINILIPENIQTQQKIASVLSKYDDLIENNNKRIKVLEETAQAIYEEWFVNYNFPGSEEVKMVDSGNDDFGMIPEGWGINKVEDIVEMLGGYAFKNKDYVSNGEYSIVTIKNVHEGNFITSSINKIDKIPDKIKNHCFLQDGDILLSLTGNIGRVCMVYGTNYLLNQRVAKLRPNNIKNIPFIYLLFRSDYLKNKMNSLANGVAQQNLSPIKTSKIDIIIPNEIILEKFNLISLDIIEETLNLQKQNNKLKETRDLLIPRLVSGELDVENLDVK